MVPLDREHVNVIVSPRFAVTRLSEILASDGVEVGVPVGVPVMVGVGVTVGVPVAPGVGVSVGVVVVAGVGVISGVPVITGVGDGAGVASGMLICPSLVVWGTARPSLS